MCSMKLRLLRSIKYRSVAKLKAMAATSHGQPPDAPSEAAVPIQGPNGRFPGIAVSELSSDQRELVSETLKVLLAPYREQDVDEVMQILKSSGGVESLHMAFYRQGDLQDDKMWDIWRIEGPSCVWHFRGAPHVHAYINIGAARTSA